MGTELYHLSGFHEPFAAMSHLLGAFVFLVLGILLLIRGRSNPAGMIYLAIYSGSVVLLLSMSGLFHMAVRGSPAHRVIERLDHAAIFILIAGSFTPILGILFHGRARWGPLIFIWTAAIVGVTLKTIFFDYVAESVSLASYLAMGWFGAYSGYLLALRFGFNFMKPLVIGGLAYSIGGVIDLCYWPVLVPGVIHAHEVFHVIVLMGIFWHWVFIWQFAKGAPVARRRVATPLAA